MSTGGPSGRLKRFSAAAAHELRNPLAAARAHLELARRRAAEGACPEPFVSTALAEIDRVWLTVEGLLLLTRGEKAPARGRRPVRLAQVLDGTLAVLRPAAEAKGVEIRLSTEPDLEVHGDADSLHLLFFKLGDNAIRFTPSGKPVRFEIRREGAGAFVRVDDSGPGLDPAKLDRLFSFFDPSANGASGSTADSDDLPSLGLSLARLLAEAHGGTFRVLARAEGGTRFEVELPVDRCLP